MSKVIPTARRLFLSLPCALLLVFLSFFSTVAQASSKPALVGPKQYYMALGDSLAYGFQPDLSFNNGYVDDFYAELKTRGTKTLANLGCSAETTTSMINGFCTGSLLRKYPYISAQLTAGVKYLNDHKGQVSPVTLDIGANDLLPDLDAKTCIISARFQQDLQTVDTNLTQVILPRLKTALTVSGKVTGDLFVMNYYDPYQNKCPSSIQFTRTINQHLAADVQGYGKIVDVFAAFGGDASPNPNTCNYTWICSVFKDIHSKDLGYAVIAKAFEDTAGY